MHLFRSKYSNNFVNDLNNFVNDSNNFVNVHRACPEIADSWILHHDSMSGHTALATKEFLVNMTCPATLLWLRDSFWTREIFQPYHGLRTDQTCLQTKFSVRSDQESHGRKSFLDSLNHSRCRNEVPWKQLEKWVPGGIRAIENTLGALYGFKKSLLWIFLNVSDDISNKLSVSVRVHSEKTCNNVNRTNNRC